MKRLLLISLSCSLVLLTLNAQNLVINPGFETISERAPAQLCNHLSSGQFNDWLPNWSTFEFATPDIIRLSETEENCTDANTHEGLGAIGLYNFHPGIDAAMGQDYHEFVQGRLRSPLQVGRTYQISIWVQLNNTLGRRYMIEAWPYQLQLAPRASNNLGIFFSETPASPVEDFRRSIEQFNLKPQVNFTEIIRSEGEWVLLEATFTANQHFRYFIIGNFYTDASAQIYPDADRERIDRENSTPGPVRAKTRRYTYYLIDDIYVGPPIPRSSPAEVLAATGSFTFQHVQFNSGEATLLPTSFAELNNLGRYLQSDTSIRIRIGGHTDNVGSSEANQQLSTARARAVYDYLISQGVLDTQLGYIGFGETTPIASNDSPEGRAQNRRVVVEVIE